MEDVLLALCGTSPAVVTETVWALARQNPAIYPDRVVALTTSTGAATIREQLLDSGCWAELRHQLGMSPDKLRFGDTGESIRVFTDATGAGELADIVTEAESARVGDFILETLRQFTENPSTRVVFSIAGGRKSMSALAALAMTMLGRERDWLCHVLVDSPFDLPNLQPRFFFPTATLHQYGSGTVANGLAARIVLHRIPFVRCRDVFVREYGRLPGRFAETVAVANASLGLPRLRFDLERLEVRVNGRRLALSEREFAFFWLLAERAWDGVGWLDNASQAVWDLRRFIATDGIAALRLGTERVKELRRVFGSEPLGSVEEPMAKEIRHLANRIKDKLLALDVDGRFEAIFPARPRRGGYGFDLPAEHIDGLE